MSILKTVERIRAWHAKTAADWLSLVSTNHRVIARQALDAIETLLQHIDAQKPKRSKRGACTYVFGANPIEFAAINNAVKTFDYHADAAMFARAARGDLLVVQEMTLGDWSRPTGRQCLRVIVGVWEIASYPSTGKVMLALRRMEDFA